MKEDDGSTLPAVAVKERTAFRQDRGRIASSAKRDSKACRQREGQRSKIGGRAHAVLQWQLVRVTETSSICNGRLHVKALLSCRE